MQNQTSEQEAPSAPPEGSAEAEAAERPSQIEIESPGDFLTFLQAKAEAYWDGFLRLIPVLIVAALILVLTWLVARGVAWVVRKVAGRGHLRESLVDLLGVVAKTLIWIVGGFMAVSVIFPSVNPGSIVAGLGLGGVVIGIAFKDIFENFLAGVLILLRRSMRIGDYIDCQDVEGRIERITLRDTYLRRTDGELVLVPNAYLFTNPVRVWTDPDHRRFEIVVGVGYGEDVDEARRVIQGAVERAKDWPKPPQVFASGFGASSIDFNVRWWDEPEPIDMHKSRDLVVASIKRALDEAGIEIPFPYRTLTFAEPLKLSRGAADDEAD